LILLTVVIQDQQAAELLRKAIAIEAYEAAALGRAPQNPDDPVIVRRCHGRRWALSG